MSEREDFSATRMAYVPGVGNVKVYDCPNDGVPKRCRRLVPRGPYNETAEHLHNGFMNVRDNATPYWAGYVRTMQIQFAELMLSFEPAVVPLVAPITAEAVIALRDKSDCSMPACKKALVTCNGDALAAEEWLRRNLANRV